MVFEIVRDSINDGDFAEPRLPMNEGLSSHDGGLPVWKCWRISRDLSHPCRNGYGLNDHGLPQDERRRNQQLPHGGIMLIFNRSRTTAVQIERIIAFILL